MEIVPNLAYGTWLAQDQQVLTYLFNSICRVVLGQVATLDTMAGVWTVFESMFSAQLRAQVTNRCTQLATLNKGSMTMVVYFSKMKTLADELASAGS